MICSKLTSVNDWKLAAPGEEFVHWLPQAGCLYFCVFGAEPVHLFVVGRLLDKTHSTQIGLFLCEAFSVGRFAPCRACIHCMTACLVYVGSPRRLSALVCPRCHHAYRMFWRVMEERKALVLGGARNRERRTIFAVPLWNDRKVGSLATWQMAPT